MSESFWNSNCLQTLDGWLVINGLSRNCDGIFSEEKAEYQLKCNCMFELYAISHF
jgi:hypothetical protein